MSCAYWTSTSFPTPPTPTTRTPGWTGRAWRGSWARTRPGCSRPWWPGGPPGGYYVFDIPVAETLDLKKAARAVGEKSVAMLPQKELLPLTGYVHGGCSPVGMKKQFPTVFDETAQLFDTIFVSAGKVGFQVEVEPEALMALVGAAAADLTV